MPNLSNIYAAAGKASNDPVGGGDAERAQKLKQQWNQFVDFAEKRGMKGSPELDKGIGESNNGIKLVKDFQKENPGTLITPEVIPEIQSHFQNYRDFTINKLRTDTAHNKITDPKTGVSRSVLPDENLDWFMQDISKVDGIPGSKTSSWRFPPSFLTTVYKGPGGQVEKKETVGKGFAKM